MIRLHLYAAGIFYLLFFQTDLFHVSVRTEKKADNGVTLCILGTAQDAGYPQAGCMKPCCINTWGHADKHEPVSCIGLADRENNASWMLDATPDFTEQMQQLSSYLNKKDSIQMPKGIFITHAHIGHYTGLMYLGKESMNSRDVPVYVMPRMRSFLQTNGPWSQLVTTHNIALKTLLPDSTVVLSNNISIVPLVVPHRGEYSETVGYVVKGKNKTALYIPDIDKWNRWEKDIAEWIHNVDYAFLDATFYKNGEVGNRNMSEIPHPFVEESKLLFGELPVTEKNKIYFIHLNHTNPLLNPNSPESRETEAAGYHIARKGMTFLL